MNTQSGSGTLNLGLDIKHEFPESVPQTPNDWTDMLGDHPKPEGENIGYENQSESFLFMGSDSVIQPKLTSQFDFTSLSTQETDLLMGKDTFCKEVSMDRMNLWKGIDLLKFPIKVVPIL